MSSSSWVGIAVLLVSLALFAWVIIACRYQPCQVCKDGEDRPALEHDRNCSLRLAFFGGQPHWDKRELQLQNDVVFYYDHEMGTWRPQLWDYQTSAKVREERNAGR